MKKQVKKSIFVCLAIVFVLFCAFVPGSIADSKPLTFGFAMPALTHSYWIPIYYGVQDECKKFNREINLVVLNAGGFDRLDNQIKQVENLVQRKVDAILIGATNAAGVVPVVKEAKRKGIAIVGLGSQPRTKILTNVLADDYGMGSIQAEFLGKHSKGKGKVAMMSGPPGLNWTIDRAKGFRETLKKTFPKMEIVAEQWTPVSRPKALNLMEDWIQRFPDLKGIYTANDDLAVGAVEAIKAAGKVDQIKVSSANPTPLGMKYLKEGVIVGFAIQQTVLQGRIAARAAYNYITRGEVVSKVLTAVLPISKENADNFDYSNVLHPKEFKP